jgi:hypothetical protein
MKRIEKNGWGQVAPCCFPDPVNLRSRRTPADGVATKTPLCIIRRASVSSTPSSWNLYRKEPVLPGSLSQSIEEKQEETI